MASSASTISTAGVVEPDSIVQRHIEKRLFLAVIFVRQLAIFELDGFSVGKERDLNCVLACLHRRGSTSFSLFCHDRSCNSSLQVFLKPEA
jgi:hypothetical protein